MAIARCIKHLLPLSITGICPKCESEERGIAAITYTGNGSTSKSITGMRIHTSIFDDIPTPDYTMQVSIADLTLLENIIRAEFAGKILAAPSVHGIEAVNVDYPIKNIIGKFRTALVEARLKDK